MERDTVKDNQDEVELLKEALAEARDVVIAQEEVIGKLSSHPYSFGTVVRLVHSSKTKEEDQFKNKELWKKFKNGSNVSIARTSEYAYQHNGEGKITGNMKKGWVEVTFSNPDYQATYRIGHPDINDGTCDLVLLDYDKTNYPTVLVHVNGKAVGVEFPDGFYVNPGDIVKLNEFMQILENIGVSDIGDTVIARTKKSVNDTCEIQVGAEGRIVYTGNIAKIEEGDKVVLDSSGILIVENLGKMDNRFHVNQNLTICWDQIGGLEEVKKIMEETVEFPHKYKDIYQFYNQNPSKGILFYGPPGCGKTLVAKATANSLAEMFGGDAVETGFIYVKGPEILDKYVGATEAIIRNLFTRAKNHKIKHGYPAILFIDESDAILPRRGSRKSADVENTIVPMFLAEMDGMDESGAIVILATNRADTLDPAVIREGRIDQKILIPRPNEDAAIEIFMVHIKNSPVSKRTQKSGLARLATKELYSNKYGLFEIGLKNGNSMIFNLSNLVSGAMIANVVSQAKNVALRRDIKSSATTGISKDDVISAIEHTYSQYKDMNLDSEVNDFAKDYKGNISKIDKIERQ